MRVTIDGGLLRGAARIDAEVLPGTPLRDVLEAAGSAADHVWCGPHRLTPDHAAGVYPFLHGALLTAEAAEPSAQPPGPHLAVVAGPDAGGIVVLDAPRTLGRGGGDLRIDDAAMSRLHARVQAVGDIVVVRDAGTTNGVRLTPAAPGAPGPRAPWRREVRLVAGASARLGDTWVEARGLGVRAEPSPTLADGADRPGRRASVMAGAGVSAIVLAAVTGRWYLALLGLAYPAATMAPAWAARLRRGADGGHDGLPDPTAPASAPAVHGVAVVGSAPEQARLARAEILARGRRPPPHPEGLHEDWLAWLPDAEAGDGPVVLAPAAPSWSARVLRASADGVAVTTEGRSSVSSTRLGVSERRAELAARRLAGAHHLSRLPAEVRWADLDRADRGAGTGPRRLAAPLGLAATQGARPETWVLDLDAQGPHLLVAGTTGSGKSALLETLILSLCERWGPADLRLALFDFKGGAGLGRCAALPHVAGVVTDLDGRQAGRALAALGAELADRKRELAAAGHASFAQWEGAGGAPARLLVVVDEFQEIGAAHRDFLPDLTRLAAQGRSLGMHLVLATQRPSGAVTPDIRANTGVTIALRVASEAESRDVIGTGAAAAIPSDAPGRAIVAWGESRAEVQVALPLATPTPAVRLAGMAPEGEPCHLAEELARRHTGTTAAERLWHDPLPPHIRLDDLAGSPGIPLGLADRAAARSRSALSWEPERGPLAAVGPPGPERLRVLRCAAAGARSVGLRPVWLPADPREAARTIALAAASADVMLLVEDAASALASLATVDRGAAAEALVALGAGRHPLACGIGPGTPHRIAAHASVRVVLAGASSHDDALWSVPRALQGMPAEPGSARAWDAQGWSEARVAEAPPAQGVSLVASLPRSVSRALLEDSRSVGIGGDDGREMALPYGSAVTVVGAAGKERDAVVEAVAAAGAEQVQVADAPLLMPPRARDGVVIAVEPTPRIAEDLCRDAAAGLVDPSPCRGRVLWVAGGVGACVQLALP